MSVYAESEKIISEEDSIRKGNTNLGWLGGLKILKKKKKKEKLF